MQGVDICIIMWGTTYIRYAHDDPHTPRDHLKLETIVEMLLKIKVLLEKIGKSNENLNDLIHYTQQTAIRIRETKIPKRFKITS